MTRICFWDAKSDEDTYIIMFNVFVTTLLLCVIVSNTVKSFKRLNHRDVMSVYALLVLWALSNLDLIQPNL